MYEGVNWNEDWVRGQTEEEFVNNPLNAAHWTQPGFTVSEKVRQARLRELYRLLVPRQSPHDWLFKKEVSHEDTQQHDSGNQQAEPGGDSPEIDGIEHGDLPDPAKGTDDLRSERKGIDYHKILNKSSNEDIE